VEQSLEYLFVPEDRRCGYEPALWGDRRLDAVSATDIEALQREAVGMAVSRRNGCGGRHAGEHVIAAARALFVCAVDHAEVRAPTRPPTSCCATATAGR
jgi:hypothetical protein